jgi:hypothetical protein
MHSQTWKDECGEKFCDFGEIHAPDVEDLEEHEQAHYQPSLTALGDMSAICYAVMAAICYLQIVTI